MDLRTGVDLVYIPRVEQILREKESVERFFHQSEVEENLEHMAGVLAAKEAFFKAVEEEPRWRDIELKNRKTGKPFLKLKPYLEKNIKTMDISISHEEDYAVAQVVLMADKGG